MRNSEYTVRFSVGNEITVYANNLDDAVILATAEQIRLGNDIRISKVFCEKEQIAGTIFVIVTEG